MFSPDYVCGLQQAELVAPPSSLKAANAFAFELVNRLVATPSMAGLNPSSLVPPNELIDLVAQTGMRQDFTAAELFILAKVSGRLNRVHLSQSYVDVRTLVTSRLHDILEARPELLHHNLHWAKPGAEGTCPMLRLLVLEGATLDPKRLQAMAARQDFAGDTLREALKHGKSVGAPLFEAAVTKAMGCVSTALAIALADSDHQDVDQEILEALRLRTAAACVGRQFQFDAAIELLAELKRQQLADGGEEKGVDIGFPKWWSLQPYDYASARNGHPITGLIYDVNVLSASPEAPQSQGVDEFPGKPLREAAAALNALLEPHQRLRLESISGLDLVKLCTLSPVNAENGSLPAFWFSTRSVVAEHSPRAVLHWAMDTAAAQGIPIPLDFFESRKLKELLAAQHGSIVARAVQHHMELRLTCARPNVDVNTPTEPPPARRRARI